MLMSVRYLPIGTFNLGTITHESYRFHGRLDVASSNVFLFLTTNHTNPDSGDEPGVGSGDFQSLSDKLHDDSVIVEYRPPDVLANCTNPLTPTIVLYDDRLFQHTITDAGWIHRLAHTLHQTVTPHLDPDRTQPKGHRLPGQRHNKWRPT
ncbi:hypothetical protein [Haloglycomyces albus]|uniref:hypothetical protein n=1 Tax=Haloglycomyces albus TaxID=526067 RepID=UPI00046D1627|nr:hypothetical protein [Haloglycomyces albus]